MTNVHSMKYLTVDWFIMELFKFYMDIYFDVMYKRTQLLGSDSDSDEELNAFYFDPALFFFLIKRLRTLSAHQLSYSWSPPTYSLVNSPQKEIYKISLDKEEDILMVITLSNIINDTFRTIKPSLALPCTIMDQWQREKLSF